jgi:RND family efflux transporter MFP subunit
MSVRSQCFGTLCLLFVLAATTVRFDIQTAQGTEPLANVKVSLPIIREISDSEQFIGRTDAAASVDLRSRATGFLEKIHFRAGAMVKRGDLLFEINSKSYRANLEKANAELALAEAQLKRAITEWDRAKGRGDVGKEELGRMEFNKAEADATVRAKKATVELAEVELDWTRIYAPIEGKVGRSTVTEGNLIVADTTSLTTIVSMDPTFVYFDMDERTFLLLSAKLRKGEIRNQKNLEFTAEMGLATDEGSFPYQGKVDFIDNHVKADKGTIQVRAVFPNPKGILLPGLFARVRLLIGNPHKAILVAEQSILSREGKPIVFVVNNNDVIEQKAVKLGSISDGLREVTEGLKAEDQIIVSGVGDLKKGTKVTPVKIDMPNSSSLTNDKSK